MWGARPPPATRGLLSCQTPKRLKNKPLTCPPSTRGCAIGHVHLKVADLPRALEFYCGVLGFEVTTTYARRRLHLGRRLPSPHRPQHLGKPGRLAAAGRHDRPLPHRHPVPDAPAARRRAAPADRSPRSRSTAPAITASPRRSTCATRTTTASSSTGTGRRSCGRRSRMARCRCSRVRSTCTICWLSWTNRLRRRFRPRSFASASFSDPLMELDRGHRLPLHYRIVNACALASPNSCWEWMLATDGKRISTASGRHNGQRHPGRSVLARVDRSRRGAPDRAGGGAGAHHPSPAIRDGAQPRYLRARLRRGPARPLGMRPAHRDAAMVRRHL